MNAISKADAKNSTWQKGELQPDLYASPYLLIYADGFFSIVDGSGGRTQCRKPGRAHTNTSAVLARHSVSKNVKDFHAKPQRRKTSKYFPPLRSSRLCLSRFSGSRTAGPASENSMRQAGVSFLRSVLAFNNALRVLKRSWLQCLHVS
jgi:hypothetical protein